MIGSLSIIMIYLLVDIKMPTNYYFKLMFSIDYELWRKKALSIIRVYFMASLALNLLLCRLFR